MDYIGPTPQEIEEAYGLYLKDAGSARAHTQDLILLVLNRIEQDLDRLAENLSEMPDLARVADTLNTIQPHGLPIEIVGGAK